MSRSRKRFPITKDSNSKELYRRIYRRKIRQLVTYYAKHYKEVVEYEEVLLYRFPNGVGIYSIVRNRLDEVPHFPLRDEVVDRYDVCDWSIYRPGDPRTYRK